MGEFGWAYIGDGKAVTASYGPTGSVQFKTRGAEISGSDRFTFDTGSNTLALTGTLIVSGTITAESYNIKNITNLNASGSTEFGDSNSDTHIFTGSLTVESASTGPASGSGTPILSASVNVANPYVYARKLAIGTTVPTGIPHAVLHVSGTISASSGFYVGDLKTSGSLTSAGGLITSGRISGSGDVTAAGQMIAEGNLKTSGSLTVIGITTLGNRVSGSGDITSTGQIVAEGNLKTSGSLISAGTITGSGDLNVAGRTFLNDELNVSGNVVLANHQSDVVTIAGQVTASAGLKFSGLASGAAAGAGSFLAIGPSSQVVLTSSLSPLTSYANAADNRVLTSVDSTSISGEANLTFDGNTLTVAGRLSGSGDVTAAGQVIAEGNLKTSGSLISVGTISGSGDLNVAGRAFLNGETNISGTITIGGATSLKANVTLGDTAADVTTATGQLTASQGVNIAGGRNLVADDIRLYFGTGQDSSIEYNENGDDLLIISGSKAGMALSSSTIYHDAKDVYFKSTASARPRLHIQNDHDNNLAGQLIFNSPSSSPADNDELGKVVFLGKDAGGNVTTYAQFSGEIKKPNAGGERGRLKFEIAEFDGTLTEALTLQGSSTDGKVDVTIANGSLIITDDNKITFGNGSDASIEYDEDGTDELRFAGAAATFEQAVTFDANVTLGNAAADVITSTGQLTASQGILMVLNSLVADDKRLFFGSNNDSYIRYEEAGDDKLIISGSKGGLGISGSAIYLDSVTVATGSRAGPASYLAVGTDNKIVLATGGGGGGGAVANYNNNGDNRVITSVDSNTISGEANLTFNGAVLTIAGRVSGSGDITAAGQIIAEGALKTSGSFAAIGVSTFSDRISGSGDITSAGQVIVEGALKTSGSLTVVGVSTFSDRISGSGDITSAGQIIAEGALKTSGSFLAGGLGTFAAGITGSGDLNVAGRTFLNGEAAVSGTITVAGVASGSRAGPASYLVLTTANTLALAGGDGNVGTSADNTFSGDNTFNGSLTAGSNLTASNGIDIQGGVKYKFSPKNLNFTAGTNEYMFFVDVTGSIITGTLPPCGDVGGGKTYIFKDVSGSASTNNLVISGSTVSNVSQLIDGATQVKITSNSGSVTVTTDGSNWFIIGTS